MINKIVYVLTGLELGEIHKEQKEEMYRLWSPASDELLAALGMKRLQEERSK
jgi:hypothetical protein